MAILTLTGMGHSTPLAAFADSMLADLQDLSDLLKEVAEEVIQPAFARNYDRSALKVRSGLLKTALTKTGARGNLLQIRAMGLTAGVDYGALPEARYAIEGRGPVRARNRKALRFVIDGKVIFTKSVKAAPGHDLVTLSEADMAKIAARLTEKLIARGGMRLPK